MKLLSVTVVALFFQSVCFADQYSYEAIAKRHPASALPDKTVESAKMQGECLVGLKDLNFKKMDKFDPVAEWTNLRSFTLLEQYSPCEVLLIIEVAQQKFKKPD